MTLRLCVITGIFCLQSEALSIVCIRWAFLIVLYYLIYIHSSFFCLIVIVQGFAWSDFGSTQGTRVFILPLRLRLSYIHIWINIFVCSFNPTTVIFRKSNFSDPCDLRKKLLWKPLNSLPNPLPPQRPWSRFPTTAHPGPALPRPPAVTFCRPPAFCRLRFGCPAPCSSALRRAISGCLPAASCVLTRSWRQGARCICPCRMWSVRWKFPNMWPRKLWGTTDWEAGNSWTIKQQVWDERRCVICGLTTKGCLCHRVCMSYIYATYVYIFSVYCQFLRRREKILCTLTGV